MKIRIVISFCLIFLLFSCKKNKEVAYDCGQAETTCMCDPAFFYNFSFTIIDKSTGEDMVFGSNPTLSVSDIKLFFDYHPPTTHIPVYVDSTKKSISTIFTKDIMWLQILNEPLRKINVKTYCYYCCNTTAVEIFYEGDVYIADNKKLISIKR